MEDAHCDYALSLTQEGHLIYTRDTYKRRSDLDSGNEATMEISVKRMCETRLLPQRAHRTIEIKVVMYCTVV